MPIGLLPDLDIGRPQAAGGALDVESHVLAFVKGAGADGQIGTMNKHVAAAVDSRKKAVALAFIEKFDLARRAHFGSPVMLARQRMRLRGVTATPAEAFAVSMMMCGWRRAQVCKARMRAIDAPEVSRRQTRIVENRRRNGDQAFDGSNE